ncbi:acyltransferase [Lysobacter sp. 5GHs7-4]|uniref:acyltransferase family protein n=1 Tax=Lysobacter sp. 5GHs7-4 TaxID=2904253 RepID=UPI001E2D8729|nr:acyltransferase [Lysobacter sp. 5GHs7-4]UHQ25028.1 acyltransferase [Lysobacter sp. 5GHs7-4]
MSRLPGLDLLRAIAVVWVMLFHSYLVGGMGEFWGQIVTHGWMGVDLFFVLSGYLIGGQLLKPLSQGQPFRPGDFYLRRAFRVLPAFLAVLAIYLAWPGFREAEGMQPVWQFLTFTLNLLIDYQHNRAFSHAWSLCVEEHFYLIFPWLAWWMTRRPSTAKFVSVCVAVLLAGLALRGYVWLYQMAPVQGLEDVERSFGRRFVEDIYYPTWMRLDGLLCGVVLAAIQVYRPQLWAGMQRRANLLLVAGLAVVGVAIWLFMERTALLPTVIGYPLLSMGLALLVAAGASTRSWLGRWRVPGAGWLALTSYSLYLIHKPVFHLVDTHLGTQLQGQGVLAFAVYAAATLAAGAVLHYSVERPFLRLRERWYRRGQGAREAVAAAG